MEQSPSCVVLYIAVNISEYRHVLRVVTDGVWIGDPLTHTPRDYTLQITVTHTIVSSVYFNLH
jgi:hypothetical protein